MMYYFPYRADLLGIGVAWDEPSVKSLREQTTVEMFYRFQVSSHLAVTPSVQFLMNPAQNAGRDTIAVAGVRGRLTF